MARECCRRSRYSFTVLVEGGDSLNKRLPHHHMVRGQRSNTQTQPCGPHTCVAQAPIRARPCSSVLVREGSRRSRYSFTVSIEFVGSLNERLSHHHMVRGQRPSTQTPPSRPIKSIQNPVCARNGHIPGLPWCERLCSQLVCV